MKLIFSENSKITSEYILYKELKQHEYKVIQDVADLPYNFLREDLVTLGEWWKDDRVSLAYDVARHRANYVSNN